MALVLVVGGAGYIGSHVCKSLARTGHTPICFDNFTTGWRDAARFGPVFEGDLLRPDDLARVFEQTRPDAVMHFAALSLVGESTRAPERYWRSNVVGALNLLDAMRATGVERLVFSSTAATYGAPDVALIDETTPQNPTNPYGTTKLAIERMIADHAAAHGLRSMVFRYFNVAGADPEGELGERHEPETHLIPIVLEAVCGRRPELIIHGDDYPTPDGTCVRDYVHVDDLATAHVLGLERLLASGDPLALNLGGGRGWSVREVIARAAAVTGATPPHVIGARRPGDPPRLVCDGARAMAELGWRPERSDLDTIIADAWAWVSKRNIPQ